MEYKENRKSVEKLLNYHAERFLETTGKTQEFHLERIVKLKKKLKELR